MKYEKSCGSIIFKDNKVLLVEQKSGYIGFPKGHVEVNETEEETAIREVQEETNVNIRINSNLRFSITYIQKNSITKEVIYFVGYPIGENELIVETCELNKVEWVDIDKVESTLTFDNLKELWKDVLSRIKI